VRLRKAVSRRKTNPASRQTICACARKRSISGARCGSGAITGTGFRIRGIALETKRFKLAASRAFHQIEKLDDAFRGQRRG
jgi:hypothetical protein